MAKKRKRKTSSKPQGRQQARDGLNERLPLAAPEQKISVINVFISSRMALQRERDAVYHAVFNAKLMPLMFEREPVDVNSKRMMEVMLDASDFFMGIYAGDVGVASDALYKLTPMEYEFWRFVIAMKFRSNQGVGIGELPSRFANRVERRMEEEFDNVRANFIQSCLSKKGPYYEVVRQRVRFLRQKDWSARRTDPEYLRYLPEECWIEIGDSRRAPFWRPYHEIYRVVNARIRDNVRIQRTFAGIYLGKDRNRPERIGDKLIRIEGTITDVPGVLEVLLRSCFQAGLTLTNLGVWPSTSKRARTVEFRIEGEPFYERIVEHKAADRFRSEVAMEVDEALAVFADSEATFTKTVHAELIVRRSSDIAVRARKPTRQVHFRVPFVDVPGALWEIVSRISASTLGAEQANITALRIQSKGRHKTVIVSIKRPDRTLVNELELIEYQLHSAICVLGAQLVEAATHDHDGTE